MLNRTTVNMEVPRELVEQMQEFMAQLHVSQPMGVTHHENIDQDGTIPWVEEVTAVMNHRVRNDQWEFRLRFASGNEWIPDDRCNCPDLIGMYLTSKKIKTIHLFCRVSTKEQTSCESTSLPIQESRLREAAELLNSDARLVVHKINGSAYQRIPPQLMEVGDLTYRGDTIMVWRVDRLSRNIVDYLSWLEGLNDRGVNIMAHQEKLSYNKNKLEFIQLIINAQKESEILASRIKSSYEHRRERGDEAVGSLPWGKQYHRILSTDGRQTVRKVVVDNPKEIMITRKIKSSRAAYGSLADKLNRDGNFKRGHRWSAMMVKRIKEVE